MKTIQIFRGFLLVLAMSGLLVKAQEVPPAEDPKTQEVPPPEDPKTQDDSSLEKLNVPKEKKADPFSFAEVKVRSFERLSVDLDDAAKVGYMETFESESNLLVEVNALVTPNWTEDLLKIIIDPKNIQLTSEGGKVYPIVGHFNYGYFEKQSWNSFSAYRPARWKEATATVPYNAVFLVPKESTKLVFKIGDVSIRLTMPEKITGMPVPADSVHVEFLSAKRIDEIPGGDISRDVEEKSIIRPLCGSLLEITIRVTPKEGNTTLEDHFFWHSSWIGLIAGEKIYCPTIGERWGTGVSLNASHNKSCTTEPWEPEELTFYFAVPEGTTDFQVMWLLSPVAKGSVAK